MDAVEGGRFRQRRRTRTAIVAAAVRLLERGETPSMSAVAVEADVSRRTVYLYFPTLEQLLIDATLGRLSDDEVLRVEEEGDTHPMRRVEQRLARIIDQTMATLPHGRSLLRLTVDGSPDGTDGPRRGYRRVTWLEHALEPIRDRLSADAYEGLVSSLAVVVGWEALVVLIDVRGLAVEDGAAVMKTMAQGLVTAAVVA